MNLRWIAIPVALLLIVTPVLAQDKAKKGDKAHTATEVQRDILDHRAMADAHLTAAKCLESGKGEKECHAQLARDCKGLGIGTLCGMKHKH
jgi:hypothetical protein